MNGAIQQEKLAELERELTKEVKLSKLAPCFGVGFGLQCRPDRDGKCRHGASYADCIHTFFGLLSEKKVIRERYDAKRGNHTYEIL